MDKPKLKRKLIMIYERFYEWRRILELRCLYRLRIMSPDRTIAFIEKHHCSIARFGDGEFDHILNLKDEGFQLRSYELTKRLADVLTNKNRKLLLCIPRCMNSVRGCNNHSSAFWIEWGRNDHHKEIVEKIWLLSGRNYLFGDSQITRPYIDWKTDKRAKRTFPKLQRLWEGRDILIVEGEQTRMGVGNDLFSGATSLKRIIAPAIGAFDYYDKILEEIIRVYKGELILMALGPTATILASDLAGKNIQALDIGNIDIEYEWFLMQAKERVPVPGKFTNEAKNGRIFTECEDKDYLNQIVARVKH